MKHTTARTSPRHVHSSLSCRTSTSLSSSREQTPPRSAVGPNEADGATARHAARVGEADTCTVVHGQGHARICAGSGACGATAGGGAAALRRADAGGARHAAGHPPRGWQPLAPLANGCRCWRPAGDALLAAQGTPHHEAHACRTRAARRPAAAATGAPPPAPPVVHRTKQGPRYTTGARTQRTRQRRAGRRLTARSRSIQPDSSQHERGIGLLEAPAEVST